MYATIRSKSKSKKSSQRYDIKFVNSNKHDEQLNFTKSSIKYKLFELLFEIIKIDEFFKNEIFADPRFELEKIEPNDINIDELLDLNTRVERRSYEGSG